MSRYWTECTTVVVVCFISSTLALFQLPQADLSDGADLADYVSRPDLRPPVFNVKVHDADAVSLGYWFVTPAAILVQPKKADQYEPYQVGPHIYDNSGDLVWSGAALVQNRNAFDFRVIDVAGSSQLSFILGVVPEEKQAAMDWRGVGIITDCAYEVQSHLAPTANTSAFNIHEFNVVAAGRRSLIATNKLLRSDITDVKLSQGEELVMNDGFQEIDMEAGAVIFEWDSLGHGLSLSESKMSATEMPLPNYASKAWDYIHINSVDKNSDGDYLISGRHTDCIYKISRVDGSVIWRLGGVSSSIELDNFNFSRQHDARFRYENSSVTIISFLDNASDGTLTSSEYSSALLVAVYNTTSPMTGKVLKRWIRPDRGWTTQRGNVQFLPHSENVFVSWSERGYLSEFSSDGRCLLEAEFISNRFNSYRAYKFNFTGSPSEPPAMKAYAYPSTTGELVSTFHVSWNGATEVAVWNFYGSRNLSRGFTALGTVTRTGFETTFVSEYVRWSYAEAMAANGTVLGESEIQQTVNRGTAANDDNPGWQRGKNKALLATSTPVWRPSVLGYVTLLVLVWVALFSFAVLTYFCWTWWTGSVSRYHRVPDTPG